MSNCIFCKIANKEISSYIVWESDTHMAFLTLWPNTDGFTVVIPKAHYDSYIFEHGHDVVNDMMAACKEVAAKIDRAFSDVGRTGVIFEGFGVNHLHAKLAPMHGTKSDEWQQHKSDNKAFYDTYPGYIASHDSVEADKEHLAAIAEKIKNA